MSPIHVRHAHLAVALALFAAAAAPSVVAATDTPSADAAIVALPSAAGALPTVSLSGGADSFSATWAPVAGATRYQLRYRQTTAVSWTTVPASAATTYTASGLSAGGYRVEVRARIGSAWKKWSGAVVTVGTTDSWDFTALPYRVRASIGAGTTARTDAIAVVPIDFGALLRSAGTAAAFDPASLRVAEVGAGGVVLDRDVPFQFDASTSDAASGELVVLLPGATPASTSRSLTVYFDTVERTHTPVTVAPRVVAVTGVADEGAAAVRFRTEIGDWWYDLAGGGFSSLDDVDGNDWISFSSAPGAGGVYRGIPNAVHPDGYFHPGKTVMTTALTRRGPLRATLETASPGGGYLARWHVYPTFAEMTMVRAAGSFWFLYEGTPGGVLEPETDIVIRSDGSSMPASATFVGDLAGDEWTAFADAATDRSLFVAQLLGDSVIDSYQPMSGLMTVFGFGRGSRPVTLLSRVPETFRVGLVDGAQPASVTGPVRAATNPPSTSHGAVELRPTT